ncbi:MAG: hypothetical protein AB7G07_12300 [Bauldia sp.]
MKTILLAAAAILLGTLSAGAAEAPTMPTAPVPSPLPGSEPLWSGPYGGMVAGLWFPFDGVEFEGDPAETTGRLNAVVGTNIPVGERGVLGIEAQFGIYDFEEVAFEAFAIGHAGMRFGERALAFASIGLAYDSAADDAGFVLGGGVEVAMNDSVSLRGETLVYRYLGSPFEYVTLSGGVIFHVGN